jgi:ParB family chromosome partitioning protein
VSDRKRSSGLGRGLSALLEEIESQAPESGTAERKPDTLVPLSRLHPNPNQPRRQFDQPALAELADSLRRQGMLQPILVRPKPAGDFEIIAGERRWRAAQLAQLHEVPIIVRELDDGAALEVALIENIQRKDLNPIEEARGYQRLMAEFAYTQEALGRFVGKSRSHVANMLRLLELPDEVLAYVVDDKLSMGHARALITTDNPAELAHRVVKDGLSVRQTEQLAGRSSAPASAPTPRSGRQRSARSLAKDPDIAAIEMQLSDLLGLPVAIDHEGGGGLVGIRYDSLDQLDFVLQKLSGGRI